MDSNELLVYVADQGTNVVSVYSAVPYASLAPRRHDGRAQRH